MGDGFPFIEIIVIAGVAGFLIVRLRSVLGKRTGFEKRRPDPFSPVNDTGEDGKVVRLPDRADDTVVADEVDGEPVPADSLAAGLMRIKLADSGFDEKEFVMGARAAFEMIVDSFAKGDVDTLRPLLSSALYGSFLAVIEEREKAGETQETTIVTIRSADIVGADLEGATASVTLEFVSEQVKATRNRDGEVIDGDPDKIELITDIWTFARDVRSEDPNWELIAARVPEE